MTKRMNPFLPGIALFAFACLAPLPTTQAVVPAPDGGYPNQNTAAGTDALFNLDTSQGDNNTAIGFDALYSNTTGYYNTAAGALALFSNTTGFYNTATGISTLYYNTTGEANTALGSFALEFNTTGSFNLAAGSDALFSNTTGSNNTANGFAALFGNTTGSSNTANGAGALETNGGSYNTATGCFALSGNLIDVSTGSNNTANGYEALSDTTTGFNNTASGFQALASNTTGSYNTASGQGSLYSNTSGNDNTAVGVNALSSNTTGSGNIALGVGAGQNLSTGNNNIYIGNAGGSGGESNRIRIGTVGTHAGTLIAGISGVTVPGGVGVIVGNNGRLGTVVSSARFKDNIQPMDKVSEAILALKPVTFIYKQELDPDGIPQFGLVAEEVAKVNPDLVARDDEGKPYTVRYEAVNAMLLNEFLKEHRTVQELKSTTAKQEATIVKQQKQIEALTAGLQKVSRQLEMSRPAPETVLSSQ